MRFVAFFPFLYKVTLTGEDLLTASQSVGKRPSPRSIGRFGILNATGPIFSMLLELRLKIKLQSINQREKMKLNRSVIKRCRLPVSYGSAANRIY